MDDAVNEDANRLADEGTAESATSLATLCVTSSTKQKKAEGSTVNMLETRVFLFIHMPPRGPELENLLDEVTDSFWGLCASASRSAPTAPLRRTKFGVRTVRRSEPRSARRTKTSFLARARSSSLTVHRPVSGPSSRRRAAPSLCRQRGRARP